jgi:serine protease AprX
VKIEIFDMLGKKITSLINENLSAGSYSVNFDASSLPTGTYIYRLSADNKVISARKMLIIK